MTRYWYCYLPLHVKTDSTLTLLPDGTGPEYGSVSLKPRG